MTTATNNDMLLLRGDFNEYVKEHSAGFENIHKDCVYNVKKHLT